MSGPPLPAHILPSPSHTRASSTAFPSSPSSVTGSGVLSGSGTVTSSSTNATIVSLIRSGEVVLRSSQRLVATASERRRKLERASTKLVVAQRELAAQATACAGMVDELATGCATFDSQTDALAQEYERSQQELQAVLDALSRRTVASSLTGPPVSPTSLSRSGPVEAASHDQPAQETLFDYVDGESVRALQSAYLNGASQLCRLAEHARNALLQRAQIQMGEVRKMEEELRDKMGVEETNNNTTQADAHTDVAHATNASPTSSSSSSSGQLLDPTSGVVVSSSVLASATAAFVALEGEVNELSRLFSELCSAYDRVRQIHISARPSSGASEGDLSASAAGAAHEVARELDRMQELERTMQTHASRAAARAAQVESASGAHAALYAETLQLFNALSAFGPSLKTALASFHALQVEHAAAVDTVQASLTELKNLQLWYVQFERSYAALLEEIQRRHRQLHHLQAFMSTVTQQLDEWHTEEQHARDTFDRAFGRYLPPSLCPAIAEEAVSVRLTPDTLVTELPVYLPTPEDQEEARRLLHATPNTQEAATSSSQVDQRSQEERREESSPSSHSYPTSQLLGGSHHSSSANDSAGTSPTPHQHESDFARHSQDVYSNLLPHPPPQSAPHTLLSPHAQYHTVASNDVATLQLIDHGDYPPHTLSPPPSVQMRQLEERLNEQRITNQQPQQPIHHQQQQQQQHESHLFQQQQYHQQQQPFLSPFAPPHDPLTPFPFAAHSGSALPTLLAPATDHSASATTGTFHDVASPLHTQPRPPQASQSNSHQHVTRSVEYSYRPVQEHAHAPVHASMTHSRTRAGSIKPVAPKGFSDDD